MRRARAGLVLLISRPVLLPNYTWRSKMTIDQVVAFVAAETNADDVVAILRAIPCWKQITDKYEVGAVALSIEDYVREVMA
jgi:hypothetical protein